MVLRGEIVEWNYEMTALTQPQFNELDWFRLSACMPYHHHLVILAVGGLGRHTRHNSAAAIVSPNSSDSIKLPSRMCFKSLKAYMTHMQCIYTRDEKAIENKVFLRCLRRPKVLRYS